MDNYNVGEGTEEGGELSNFIKDTIRFYQEFNDSNPRQFEVESENRIGMSVIFLLSRIANSLENIQDSLMREKENKS